MRRQWIAMAMASLATAGPLLATAIDAAPARAAGGVVTITVLSGRADLVTEGSALIRLELPAGSDPTKVTVTDAGRDVTAAFAVRKDGHDEGLVTGLPLGASTLTATLPDGTGATLVLTNHPASGPLFSGPPIQPWVCNTTAPSDGLGSMQPTFLGASTDADCSTPTLTKLYYLPPAGNVFEPYDPAQTPTSAIATTTTQTGVTMPFIVRVEQGVLDRDIFSVATLWNPALPWTAVDPQPQWNGKFEAMYGGGDDPDHEQALNWSVMDDHALGQGYVVMGSALDVLAFDSNPVVAAEGLAMLKEHVIKGYGVPRFTIGSGCSGGGLLQDLVASQYPGLLDGILPACNYLDIWSTAPEVVDCFLLDQYTSRVPAQTANVQSIMGYKDSSDCVAWDQTFAGVEVPSTAKNCSLDASVVYDPATNPGGTRCDLQDYQKNIWGQRPVALWTDAERKLGRGFAPTPESDIGVPFGMAQLAAGTLSPADFAAINAGVGGIDADRNVTAARNGIDPVTLDTAYRTGEVTDARIFSKIPIIDLRANSNEAEIHTDVHSDILKAREDAEVGGHANAITWTYPVSAPIVGVTPPRGVSDAALDTMDAWLTTITAAGGTPTAANEQALVAASRPGAAVDTCFVGAPSTAYPAPTTGAPTETAITDPAQCALLYPHYSDPRLQAGSPLASTVLQCQLKPLTPADFPGVTFAAADWATLVATFPTGICDYTLPGQGERTSVPWQTFAAGPGGQPMPAAPVSVPFAPATATTPVTAGTTAKAGAGTTPKKPTRQTDKPVRRTTKSTPATGTSTASQPGRTLAFTGGDPALAGTGLLALTLGGLLLRRRRA